MRTKNILYTFLFLVFVFPACKKEAGTGGKKTVSGTVYYHNGVTGADEIATGAAVSIVYGATSASTDYDQTVQSNSSGSYHFDNLTKGNYFITAEYTDANGFKYTTGGYTITVEKKKGTLTVDIHLQ